MSLFRKKTPEEIAAEEEDRNKARAQQRVAEFYETPAGRSYRARQNGANTFQIVLSISETTAHNKAVFLMVVPTTQTTRRNHGSIIDSIEARGWKLEHANYVYEMTGLKGANHARLNNTMDEAVSGSIIGVYIFRRVEDFEELELETLIAN